MKLVSLNLWGGRQGDQLFDYLQKESVTADIFCFQEVFSSASGPKEFQKAHPYLFEELKQLLPDFQAIFSSAYKGWMDMEKVDFDVSQGQTMFVRKPFAIKDSGQIYIFGNANTEINTDFKNEPKIMQFVLLEKAGKQLLVGNIHGCWFPGEKLDTVERLEQSRVIVDFIKKYNCPKVVVGDLNLELETKSIKILEKELRNLIKEYSITNTRNEISWERYHNRQSYADYAFVSSDINVKNFEVPYSLVSDHLPMLLDFSL